MYRVIVDQIEVHPQDGSVTVRFIKQHVDSLGVVVDMGYHRGGALDAGDDVDDYIAALNGHFKAGVAEKTGAVIRYSQIAAADQSALREVVALVHTPARIAARRKRDQERAATMPGA